MSRRILPAVLLLLVTAAAPATAAAGPPPGDWTFVRKDAFRHYACKQPSKGNAVQVRVASWLNGKDDAAAQNIGQYAAVARGSDDNVVRERTITEWQGGYIQTVFKGVRESDRVWIQGSYYGPPSPWSGGFRIGRLVRCDPR
jgi:hypothetical protein